MYKNFLFILLDINNDVQTITISFIISTGNRTLLKQSIKQKFNN